MCNSVNMLAASVPFLYKFTLFESDKTKNQNQIQYTRKSMPQQRESNILNFHNAISFYFILFDSYFLYLNPLIILFRVTMLLIFSLPFCAHFMNFSIAFVMHVMFGGGDDGAEKNGRVDWLLCASAFFPVLLHSFHLIYINCSRKERATKWFCVCVCHK